MEASQALKVLMKVAAIWTRQPTDEAVEAEWCESLSRVSFQAALEAVRDFRDGGRQDAPTPGEIYREAAGIDKRAEDQMRRRTLKLVDHSKPNGEELTRVRAVAHGLTERPKPSASQGAATAAEGQAIDAETGRAQDIILAKRRELGIEAARR